MGEPLREPVPRQGYQPVLDERGYHLTDDQGKPRYYVGSSSGPMSIESLQEVRATSTLPFESLRRALLRFLRAAKQTFAYVGRPDDGREQQHHHGSVVEHVLAPVIAVAAGVAFVKRRREMRRQSGLRS